MTNEHTLAGFDPQFAQSVGIRTRMLELSLTVQTALTLLAAFRSVGSFLALAWLFGIADLRLCLGQELVTASGMSVTLLVMLQLALIYFFTPRQRR